MSNRLDQLFKDKLADHAIPPSSQTWGRVRENLSKKNRVPRILRLAAAILLLCAVSATIVWWSSANPSDQVPAITKENTEKSAAPGKEVVEIQPASPRQAVIKQPKTVNHIATTVIKKDTRNRVAETNKEPLRDETLPESPLNPITPIVTTSTVAPEKPIVLEYRLESIQPPAVATAESKEKSGFKKVIEFALEAKHSDGPAGLRQAKDELFALNFIKDKQKNHK